MKHPVLHLLPLFILVGALCRGASPAIPPPAVKDLFAEAKQAFDGNFKGAFASYHTDGIDRALAVYRQALAHPGATDLERVEALRGIADCHFERMEVVEANAALDQAVKLPGLAAADLRVARKNQADGLRRQLADAEALAIYDALLADARPAERREIEKRILECLVNLGRAQEGLARFAAWRRPAIDSALYLFETLEDPVAARKAAEAVLADAAAPVAQRQSALELLFRICAAASDVDALIATAERHMPGLVAEQAGSRNLYRNLASLVFTRAYPSLCANPAFIRWLAGRILETPDLTAAEFVKQHEALQQDAISRRDPAGARAAAEAVLAREDVPAAARRKHALIAAVLDGGDDAARTLVTVDAAIQKLGGADDDPSARAAALLQAAQFAVAAGLETSGRALHAAREKMSVRHALRSLPCTFIDNGPSDIAGFLDSAYFKDVRNRGRLDRKYGDNVQFLLETDAALTGRKVTEATADFKPTEFVATCDADGVKIFLFAPTAQAKAIADGYATLGGYELYLASGPTDPYHCYLFGQIPGPLGDGFVTQYDNASFRRARMKDGGVAVQHRVLEDGVATLLAFSWKAFFNRVPGEGDAWSFEVLHWEQGGYSWGGSQSVHNRSSFGSLVFANLTEANVRAIKRRLIPAAAAAYKRELHPNNGCVEIWQDPELGDRTFYAEVVKPLQAKLDAALAEVKPDLADADVDRLFAEAVPTWMNIQYVLADLRRDYLDRLRVEGR